MPLLPPNQQHKSTEGRAKIIQQEPKNDIIGVMPPVVVTTVLSKRGIIIH